MAQAVSYEELSARIEGSRPDVLENFELTDVFRGNSIPADKVSFSMAFTYRAPDRTLTGEEVNAVHRQFVAKLVGAVGSNSTIRSAAMSFKEFDKLEEKINRLISGMKALRDENQKLKKELQEIKHDSSQRDSEKSEVRKKIASLIDLVDSLGE